MAYITTQEVKVIREELKRLFPTVKFSVTREHCSVLKVAIMSGPFEFEKGYMQLNEFYLNEKKHKVLLKMINAVCNEKNFNNSDLMTDYHHVGYYFHFSVGKWYKPYVMANKKAVVAMA